MTILAADIGGTYSRLAWLDSDPTRVPVEQHFANAEFDSLEQVIAQGLTRLGPTHARVERMVLALPAPINGDPIRLTNIDWQVQQQVLRERFGVGELILVNDFQAAAIGAIGMPRAHLTCLNEGSDNGGPTVVVGAGTGLGMAWLASREQTALPHPCEGGHMDFAPRGEAQLALYRWLAERFGHVSYERILSGAGLLDCYRHLAGQGANADSPREIAALAAAADDTAVQSVNTFVAIFAAYVGNLALAFNPGGGIYLCGGLTTHLADWFRPRTFMRDCADKGRMSDSVLEIPIFLATTGDAGLAGAIQIAQDATLRASRS